MKTPDSNPSMKHSPPSNEAEDNAQPVEATQALDPLDTLLAEEAEAEVGGDLLVAEVSIDADPDEERLYTDEFIRANENASRSLFLGFLGLALLATSLIAWILLSSDPQEEPQPEPLAPVIVPSEPPSDIPDLRLDSVPTEPTQSGTSPQSTDSPQAPLVFPVQPGQTTPAPPPPGPSEEGTGELTPEIIPTVPEGAVPPPPPVNP